VTVTRQERITVDVANNLIQLCDTILSLLPRCRMQTDLKLILNNVTVAGV